MILCQLRRDLVAAVPSVALAPPRPRVLELLPPGAPRRPQVHRRVTEIRDAIPALRDYGPPRRGLHGCRTAASRAVHAAAVSAWLRAACRAKRCGRPPLWSATFAVAGAHDLAGETAFLVVAARPGGTSAR
ncbi:DUF6545 domain-containing protein [Kitasatospora sp. NPDC091207]|uniref:DUF6545 domain-containing protein n=1 Tax=Kitasatospora sp. NPDC091207 TaxID=3364083 RepID=UPI0037F9B910